MRCPAPVAALLVALPLLAPGAAGHAEDPDCGFPSDASDSFDHANLVALPLAACPGILHSSWDSTDFYKFRCETGQRARFDLVSTSLEVNLRAYLPVWAPRPLAWDSTTGDHAARIELTCWVPGEYRIQILHGGLKPGLYFEFYNLTGAFV